MSNLDGSNQQNTENTPKDVEVVTTESSKFDDIRHYRNDEVPNAIQSILNNDQVISGISGYMFKRVPKFLSFIVKPFVKAVLKKKFAKVKTIREVQEYVAQFMNGIIRDTTDGFTYSGFDKLDKNKGYLFISNHRDISLDPAFINMACFAEDLDTVKIAIGDNLLRMPVATDLMKLNKSFIVKRSISSPKEKLKAFSELSEYIGLAIKENHNVWIAEREGRAKDGNDIAEAAIMKMFYIYGKKQGFSFKDYIKQLNIVPVSITYEYDPRDIQKARELYESAQNGEYIKSEFEDIESIVGGITGYKGHVHISAGAPLCGDYENAQELADEIDRYVHKHYRMFPSILAAANVTENLDPKDKEKFEKHMAEVPQELKEIVRSMYAKAYENNQKAQTIQAKH